ADSRYSDAGRGRLQSAEESARAGGGGGRRGGSDSGHRADGLRAERRPAARAPGRFSHARRQAGRAGRAGGYCRQPNDQARLGARAERITLILPPCRFWQRLLFLYLILFESAAFWPRPGASAAGFFRYRDRDMEMAALQRLAQATNNEGYSPASPLQAPVRRRTIGFVTCLCESQLF